MHCFTVNYTDLDLGIKMDLHLITSIMNNYQNQL